MSTHTVTNRVKIDATLVQTTICAANCSSQPSCPAITALESALIRYKTITDTTEAAYWIRDVILQKMAELRVVCDEAETLTAESYWPFPTYEKLLFGVK